MRQISIEVLKERKTKILSAVIYHYIKTGKPVGSSTLIDEYSVSLSPAAVRNVMVELEEEELLISLEKIKKLDPSTIVYPGHESMTTIANELKHNPFLIR